MAIKDSMQDHVERFLSEALQLENLDEVTRRIETILMHDYGCSQRESFSKDTLSFYMEVKGEDLVRTQAASEIVPSSLWEKAADDLISGRMALPYYVTHGDSDIVNGFDHEVERHGDKLNKEGVLLPGMDDMTQLDITLLSMFAEKLTEGHDQRDEALATVRANIKAAIPDIATNRTVRADNILTFKAVSPRGMINDLVAGSDFAKRLAEVDYGSPDLAKESLARAQRFVENARQPDPKEDSPSP